ncbi:MAG TPA: DUF1161 domain-containing protein [Candidatus Sulfotelmatobacter sp.]|nr:DUF1161 domain-containing protein [Candidatus Sulfotelmatobacter sp.]
MKPFVTIAALLFASVFASVFASAQAAKPCEELKAEIAKKMDANHVKSYTLDIVDKDKDAEGRIVGTCDGGTKKIVYQRATTPPPSPAPAPDASKP